MPVRLPLFRQEKEDNCSLACLRMILASYGIQVTESRLEAEVHKDLGGVFIEDLAQLSQRYGFTGEIVELDLDAVGNLLAQGVFAIVYLNRLHFGKKMSLSRRYTWANAIFHAVVPTHVSPTFVTFNDPLPPGKQRRASRRKFEAAQLDMNHWCVVCRPR
jgi:ABC-type bacteriocin/lantibiotic exporter with double-glycine peptidase domain